MAANPYVIGLGKPETAATRLNLKHRRSFVRHGDWSQVRRPADSERHAACCRAVAPAQSERLYACVIKPLIKILHHNRHRAGFLSASALGVLNFLVRPKGSRARGRMFPLGSFPISFSVRCDFYLCGRRSQSEASLSTIWVCPRSRASPAALRPGFVSIYWGGAMMRFLNSALLNGSAAGRLLIVYAVAAATLVTFSMLGSGHAAMWSMILVGFFQRQSCSPRFSPGRRLSSVNLLPAKAPAF